MQSWHKLNKLKLEGKSYLSQNGDFETDKRGINPKC